MKVTISYTRLAIVACVIAALAAALALAGCGNKFRQSWNDAPRTRAVNNGAAEVIAMPDGFNNLATKCDHGNRIYVSFHSDGPYGFGFVVPHDPTCLGH